MAHPQNAGGAVRALFGRFIATAANSRGDMIRTCDLLVPHQALYQAELRPECGSYSETAEEVSEYSQDS